MKKLIAIIVLLLSAIGITAYLYFSDLHTANRSDNKLLKTISINSGLIFNFKNDKIFYDVFKDYQVFTQLMGIEKTQQLSLIKQLLVDNPKLGPVINKQNVYVCFIPTTLQNISLAFATAAYHVNNNTDLAKQLNIAGIKFQQEKELLKINLSDSSSIYLFAKNETALISFDQETANLLLHTNEQAANEDLVNYIDTESQRNKNAQANIFLNFNKIPDYMRALLKNKLSGDASLFNKLNGYAALNFNYRGDALMLSGESQLDEPQSYYSIFANQLPATVTIKNLLPDNTASYTAFTVSNYSKFKADLIDLQREEKTYDQLNKQLQKINSTYTINLDRDLSKYLGNEFISFELSTQEKLAAIKLSNGDKVGQLFNDISTAYDDKIRSFKISDVLYTFFGHPFKKFARPYFTIIDNYLVVANAPSTLQSFLNSYTNNKLLTRTPEYIEFNDQVLDKSNICLFIHGKNSKNTFRSSLKPAVFKNYNNETTFGYQKFYALSLQLSGDKGKFLSNFILTNTKSKRDSSNISAGANQDTLTSR